MDTALIHDRVHDVGFAAPIGVHPRLTATVLELLDAAGTALERDSGTARAYLARAAALVSAMQEPREEADAAPGPLRGGLARWQMQRLNAYIDDHLGVPVTAADLASLTRLSASHFFRAFKVSFGEAPCACVARRRIRYAQRLMLTTSQPLSQIALACGLCDQSHFTRVFRRIVGVSPGIWRREHARG